MLKNLKFKPFLISFFVFVIFLSFLVLKIGEKLDSRDFIDTNTLPERTIEKSEALKVKYSSQLKKFSNFEEFSTFIEDNRENYRNDYAYNKEMDTAAPQSSEAGSDSLDFSTTNIQVQGVDEADIVKTDGDYIYYVANNVLYIIKSYPAEETEVLSRIEFKEQVSEIYLKEDTLVVFSTIWDSPVFDEPTKMMAVDSMIWRGNSKLSVQFFNVLDRSNPEKIEEMTIDGYYTDSRLIGGYLYLVVNNYSQYNLPIVRYGNKEINFDCQGGVSCGQADIYYADSHYDGFSLSTVVSLNIDKLENGPKANFYLLPGSQNIYVSKSNIYLTHGKYLNEYEIETDILLDMVYPRLLSSYRELIDEILATSDKVLSLGEKRAKVRNVLNMYTNLLSPAEQNELEASLVEKIKNEHPNLSDEIEKTVIHKLSIFEDRIEPLAVAEVSGSVLNQFSMDEYDGLFRIATTRNRVWSRFVDSGEEESSNNLYVLDANMVTIGELKGLASGERIYSARFMGDKAYLVTFKQVDPLFAIDLKDPYNPRVLGELKVPGFSNYLHPYDNNTLIGLGRDVIEDGDRILNGGIKLSLFDVSSDVPVELNSYIIGDSSSYSIALYDHKAFMFSKDKNILVIPAVLNDQSFNGLLIFKVVDNKFVLSARISHRRMDSSEEYFYYNNSVNRGLYIEDYLYSLSSSMLKINSLEDFEEFKSIDLE
ncbi:MAG: beta-propeller domain-containing protein [Patescibacteria group bacterium]